MFKKPFEKLSELGFPGLIFVTFVVAVIGLLQILVPDGFNACAVKSAWSNAIETRARIAESLFLVFVMAGGAVGFYAIAYENGREAERQDADAAEAKSQSRVSKEITLELRRKLTYLRQKVSENGSATLRDAITSFTGEANNFGSQPELLKLCEEIDRAANGVLKGMGKFGGGTADSTDHLAAFYAAADKLMKETDWAVH